MINVCKFVKKDIVKYKTKQIDYVTFSYTEYTLECAKKLKVIVKFWALPTNCLVEHMFFFFKDSFYLGLIRIAFVWIKCNRYAFLVDFYGFLVISSPGVRPGNTQTKWCDTNWLVWKALHTRTYGFNVGKNNAFPFLMKQCDNLHVLLYCVVIKKKKKHN